jgi:hypothetical protein
MLLPLKQGHPQPDDPKHLNVSKRVCIEGFKVSTVQEIVTETMRAMGGFRTNPANYHNTIMLRSVFSRSKKDNSTKKWLQDIQAALPIFDFREEILIDMGNNFRKLSGVELEYLRRIRIPSTLAYNQTGCHIRIRASLSDKERITASTLMGTYPENRFAKLLMCNEAQFPWVARDLQELRVGSCFRWGHGVFRREDIHAFENVVRTSIGVPKMCRVRFDFIGDLDVSLEVRTCTPESVARAIGLHLLLVTVVFEASGMTSGTFSWDAKMVMELEMLESKAVSEGLGVDVQQLLEQAKTSLRVPKLYKWKSMTLRCFQLQIRDAVLALRIPIHRNRIEVISGMISPDDLKTWIEDLPSALGEVVDVIARVGEAFKVCHTVHHNQSQGYYEAQPKSANGRKAYTEAENLGSYVMSWDVYAASTSNNQAVIIFTGVLTPNFRDVLARPPADETRGEASHLPDGSTERKGLADFDILTRYSEEQRLRRHLHRLRNSETGAEAVEELRAHLRRVAQMARTMVCGAQLTRQKLTKLFGAPKTHFEIFDGAIAVEDDVP